jgi:O-antigen/teichoic acid export membrane protein
MVVEGLQRINMYQHVLGAALNILGNWLMIPTYGMVGAAAASICSFVIANYVSDLFHPKTRVLFVQKSHALFFIWAFRMLKRA